MNGEIDNVRIWSRALSPAEIARVAAGAPADSLDREGLLLEYLFEGKATHSKPVAGEDLVADTSGHPDGTLHARLTGDGFYTERIAEVLQRTGASSRAMSFDFPFPTSVDPGAAEYYLGLYRDHSHPFGFRAINLE